MSSRFWSQSPLEEEYEREEYERQGRRSNDRYEEESYYQEPRRSRTQRDASPIRSTTSGNPEFFQGAPRSKSTKQQKQERKASRKERKAAIKERIHEERREARYSARKEQTSLDKLSRWEYAALWKVQDRSAYGTAFDDFSTSAAAFIRDNTKEFPRLKKHGCERHNCVKGELLGVCHHEVEATLRGSGCFDEKTVKKERLRWHPDRWTGKGELQKKSNELFQLIQRVIDGDANA